MAQGRLLGMGRILDADLTAQAVAAMLVEEGLTTAAIEGERLDPDQVRSSVARHLGLPTAGLPRVSFDVEGLVEVLLDATHQHTGPLTLDRLCGWHGALFPAGRSGLHRIRTGQLRGEEPMQVVSGSAGRERVHFLAPPREILDAELAGFLAWFNAPPARLDGLVRAGLTHFWFVTLHPFEDGNGRLTRAITDMAIAQDEQDSRRLFTLSAQILRAREAYYAVLERSQRDRADLDLTAWLVWFLEQVTAACAQAEETIHRVLYKARYWLRFGVAPLNARQRKVLDRLLDAGPGSFEGGMTARKYVCMTNASKATATRDLTALVDLGCLVQTEAGGRSVAYEVPATLEA